MGNTIRQRNRHSGPFMQKVAFWTITVMHDNPLLPFFKNPYKLLEAAGLKRGQKVLEVGCGPGFFTIPAAHIVGEEGRVYAVDVNPYAIERVRGKIARDGIKNVVPLLANASDTGLPEYSIDFAFMVGLPHIVGGREAVLSEIHRILKPGGVLSYKRTRGPGGELNEAMEKRGFVCSETRGRILRFVHTSERAGI
jgi:ubiquinone/menaquinone biosynthesis C-methylase UbiE